MACRTIKAATNSVRKWAKRPGGFLGRSLLALVSLDLLFALGRWRLATAALRLARFFSFGTFLFFFGPGLGFGLSASQFTVHALQLIKDEPCGLETRHTGYTLRDDS